MLILIERELGTYNEADLIQEIADAKKDERKRIIKLVYSISQQLPEKYQETRKKHTIAKDVSENFYYELKRLLEII